MARIVYIGDELTAAGFRLAGLDARVASQGDAGEVVRQALADECECVLFAAGLSDCIPATLLDAALVDDDPLFALVPDIRARETPPDLARQVRAALGIDT